MGQRRVGGDERTTSGVAASPPRDMRWVPGATYRMGSERYYPEERPVHPVTVEGFWMDRFPVTNARFARFVEATGHVTLAEVAPDPADYPGALPELLRAGSAVFVQPAGPVDLRDIRNWWRYVPGADWRHPSGPGSTIDGLDAHPVVHVGYADAEAFAAWEGKALPTEAEWELAARGGLEGSEFAWGDALTDGGRHLANTWQGAFPWQNLAEDGFERTSPAGSFPANGYGLYDMIGNVWEWTTDWYRPRHPDAPAQACCLPQDPRGTRREDSIPSAGSGIAVPRKVLKGGSHLCAPNYCQRYRPAARFPEPIDSSTSHVGFRCVLRALAPKLHT